MNNSSEIAKIYAKAIAKVGLDKDKFLRLLSEIYTLKSFDVSKIDVGVIKSLPLLQETQTLLQILIKNKKLYIIKDLFLAIKKEFLQSNKITLVEIKSSKSLNMNEAESIKIHLETKLKKNVVVEQTVDESLIGGFTLLFDSLYLDFSKKAKILKIRTCFLR